MRSGEIIMPAGARGGLCRAAGPDTAGQAQPQVRLREGAVSQRAGALSLLLAAMPILDVVLAQVQTRWAPQVGPLSMAQAYHGALLAALAVILGVRLAHFPPKRRYILFTAASFAAAIGLSMAVHAAARSLTLEDLVASFQVAYWLLLWPAALVVCRTFADCRRVLWGIALAGAYAALSVIYFYFAVGESASPYEGVAASAGGLRTAKGLTGILITGGLAAAWLCRAKMRALGMIVVAVCLLALFLTYQRAGLVAAGLALGWLAIWYASRGRGRPEAAWVRRLLAMAAVATIAILVLIGTSDLRKRWSDLPDPEKAGSARLAFWQVVTRHYDSLSTTEKLFGIGYASLVDAMEDHYGSRIHTHNDLLDVLAIFGLVGVLFWLAVHAAVIRSIRQSRARAPVFAVSVAVYLVMLSEGLLTGQIFAPAVMAVYLTGLVCWSRLAACGARPLPAAGAGPLRRRQLVGPGGPVKWGARA